MSSSIPKWPDVGQGKKIVVIGGGLAGLASSYSLMEAGYQTILLESSSRIGGRVYSLYNHFKEQYSEMGAVRIFDSHHLALAYCQRFGLELKEFPSSFGQRYLVDGRCYTGEQIASGALKDLFGSKKPSDIINNLIKDGCARLSEVKESGWPNSKQEWDFDNHSFSGQLKELGASDPVLKLARVQCGSEADTFNALSWFALEKLAPDWSRVFSIVGGNSRLPQSFAEALKDKILLDAPVRSVTRKNEKLRVIYEHKGVRTELECDYVVCTAPPPLVAKITFDPPLSSEKQNALSQLDMLPVSKISLQFDDRFWNKEGKLSGLSVAYSDLSMERVWDITANQSGKRGILTAMFQNDNAIAMAQLKDDSKKTSIVMEQLRQIFPDSLMPPIQSHVFEWEREPWIKGAFVHPRAGQFRALRSLKLQEGPIHFAGDHTSLLGGFLEGALQSAHRVTEEILNLSVGK